MMNVTSAHTKLNILLNNTNKALVQVLLDATKDDLKSITKDTKDLRSIMDKILKQTKTAESSSNKAMLDLVKNNPTLKNLGSPSTTIKELLNTMKSDKKPLPVEKVLKEVLIDIKNIKNQDVKFKLNNTGVFLESKLKNVNNPQVELKNNLNDLKEILQQSKVSEVKEVLQKVEVLLQNKLVKNATNVDLSKELKQNPKLLESVAKEVKVLVQNLDKLIQKSDGVHSTTTKILLDKLEFAIDSTKTKLIAKELPLKQDAQVKQDTQVKQDIQVKQKTQVKQEQTMAKEIDLKSAPMQVKDPVVKQNVPLKTQELHTLKIGANEQKVQNISPKELIAESKVPMTTKLVENATIKLPIVKEVLQVLQGVLDKSLILESKAILKVVTSTLNTLENVKEVTKESKQDLGKIIQDTKALIAKADVINSKDIITIFAKLKNLTSANSLNVQANVKEILNNDLKSALLQTTNELQNSSHPNKNDLIKQMDKLVLQIDSYQLVSHLSNGTAVYLPITWDQLEGGELQMRQDKEKFYCDIDLNLKDYGDVSLKLTLFEKNQINIHLYSPNQELKELFQENLSILRAGMIHSQIVPREIRFHDGLEKASTSSSPYQGDDDFNIGFEVKG